MLILHTLRHIYDDCPRYPSCDLTDALGYTSLVVKMVIDYVAMEKDYYWPQLTIKADKLEPNPVSHSPCTVDSIHPPPRIRTEWLR